MIVHVLPGDAQVEEFKKTGLEGDVVVCREAFVDGDVRAASLDDLWRVRERYLSGTYPDASVDYRKSVAAEFEKLLDLPASAEIDLWFEYELFCQVNMWFCLWLLRDTSARIYRIAPIVQRKDRVWFGFGDLTSEDLVKCHAERLRFADRDVKLGVDLWTAFQDRDHAQLMKLSKTESACFPYLRDAVEAETEKETRPRDVLRQLMNEGVHDSTDLMAEFRNRAGVYGYGDAQINRILNEV